MAARRSSNKRIREGQKIARKRAARRWWHTTRRRMALIGALTFVSYAMIAVTWFAYTGGFSRTAKAVVAGFYHETALLGFRTTYVFVEGRRDTALADIIQAIDVKQDEPILAISVGDMRSRLAALPRVRTAQVERVLPNQLTIHVQERVPVAVWQHENRLQLVDSEGKVMPEDHMEKYAALPLVVGTDAPAHTAELLAFVDSEPELRKILKAAVMVGGRRWNVRFVNGMELRLPEHSAEEAWHKFAELNREQKLVERDILRVDMRIEDRIFIKSAAPRPIVASGPSRET